MLYLTSINLAIMTIGLILSYWMVSQIHSIYCAPYSFTGLFQTAIMMGSPLCQGTLMIMTNTTQVYLAILMALICSFSTFIISMSKLYISYITKKI